MCEYRRADEALIRKHRRVVGNAKTIQMIQQFFAIDTDNRVVLVKEGDTLSTRKTYASLCGTVCMGTLAAGYGEL